MIALSIFPSFSDKTLPLGLACIQRVIRQEGYSSKVFDFDFLMGLENPELYYTIHRMTVQSSFSIEPDMINYIGVRLDVILSSLFGPSIRSQLPFDLEIIQTLEKIDDFVNRSVNRILSVAPDEIWMSVYISNIWISMLAASVIRKHCRCRILFGGPAVFPPEVQRFLLFNDLADAVVVGEAELTVKEYLRSGFNVVKGMAWLEKREYRYVPRTEKLLPKEFPHPDFEGFPFDNMKIKDYFRRRYEGIPISFSRGCINGCNYCSERSFWGQFRPMKASDAVGTLEHMADETGVLSFYICDSLINFSHKWLMTFCTLLKKCRRRYIFTFSFCSLRYMPPEIFVMMAEVGFTRISFGLESASEAILKRMNKKIDIESAANNLVAAARAGLQVQVSTITGYPGETLADVIETIKFFKDVDDRLLNEGVLQKHLPRRTLNNRFRLEPSTPFYQKAKSHGLVVEPFDVPGIFPPEVTREIAMRWRLANENVDDDLNRYIAMHFSNKDGPWRFRNEQYARLADSIMQHIDDDDRFAFAPHIVLRQTVSKGELILGDHDDEYVLTGFLCKNYKRFIQGISLREVYSIFPAEVKGDDLQIKRFILSLYTRRILVLI